MGGVGQCIIQCLSMMVLFWSSGPHFMHFNNLVLGWLSNSSSPRNRNLTTHTGDIIKELLEMGSRKEADKEERRDGAEKEETEENAGYNFHSFVEETSIHGVRNAFARHKCKKHRVVWTVLGTAAVAYLLKIVCDLFLTYGQFPVRTRVTVHPANTVPFPAVTLCNFNGIELSKLRAQDTELFNLSQAVENLASYYAEMRKRQDLNESSDANQTLIGSSNIEEFLNHTFEDFSTRVFSELNSTVVHCMWDNHQRNCADLFSVLDLGDRRCFQFNNMLTTVTTAQTQAKDGGSGWTQAKDGGSGRTQASKSGMSSGLQVTLNVSQEEYTFYNPRSITAGIQVILHEPDEVPDLQKGFSVSPGFTHFAQLQLTKFHYLPMPYRAFGDKPCIDDVRLPPAIHQQLPNISYTPSLCLDICLHNMSQTICRCRVSSYSLTYNASLPLCTMGDMYRCYYSTFENRSKQVEDYCHCPRPCRHTEYRVLLSNGYFPSFAAQKLFHQLNLLDKASVRQNLLILKLFYDDMLYYEVSHQPEHTMETVLSRLGGQMGLFMGASLLSLAEVLQLLLMLCCRAARARVGVFLQRPNPVAPPSNPHTLRRGGIRDHRT